MPSTVEARLDKLENLVRVLLSRTTAAPGASALDDLTDVVLTSPTNGQVVKYNGSNWINDTDATGGGALDDITDVTITAAATGDILRYNGAAWVDYADSNYAASAAGVTNGNTHDHSGGDGAQIDHTTLSNIGTNTHAQIDTAVTASTNHIADASDPHGATLTQTTINATTLQLGGVSVTSTAAELNTVDGVTSSAAELNLVDGSIAGTIVNSKAVIYSAAGQVNATSLAIGGTAITSSAAELNIVDGVTSTAAELNALDGITSTVTELNYTDGVTSAIQTQLDAITDGVDFTGASTAADHGTAATDQLVNVCYGTGSAPTASTTTEGALWIKYTA